MNQNTKISFESIKAIYKSYQEQAETVAQIYISEIASNNSTYAEKVAKERNDNLRITAKAKIADLAAAAKMKMEKELEEIRSTFAESVTEAPQQAFVDKLMIYHNAGMKLTKAEIEAYIAETKGNYLCLRLLQKVAAESGYEVNFPDADALEADLKPIRNLANRLDVSLPSRAFSLAPETYIVDGYQMPVEPLVLITNNAAAESLFKRFDEISERWTQNISPTVKSLENAARELKTDAATLAEVVQKTPDGITAEPMVNPEDLVYSDPKVEQKAAEGRKHYFG